ncbi:MAG: methyl-accepting chemotaxis protein [Bacillus sp. (in: firmicutes)]
MIEVCIFYGVYIYTSISLIITTVISTIFIRLIVILPLKSLLSVTRKVANGDLNIVIPNKTNDEIGQLISSFEKMLGNLGNLVGKMNETSAEVALSADQLVDSVNETTKVTEQISNSIHEVSIGTEDQTVSLEKLAHSIINMKKEINEIAVNTEKVSWHSKETIGYAAAGEEAVEKTVHQMKLIQESVSGSNKSIQLLQVRSREIEQILNVISDIANQTNLLALNAAIEAARAGQKLERDLLW